MTMRKKKISFLLPKNKKGTNSPLKNLREIYGDFSLDQCDVIVALGGDGFMLDALHIAKSFNKPFLL